MKREGLEEREEWKEKRGAKRRGDGNARKKEREEEGEGRKILEEQCAQKPWGSRRGQSGKGQGQPRSTRLII